MILEQAIEAIKQCTEQSEDNFYIICVDNNRYLVKLHKDGDKFLTSCQYKRFVKYDKGYAPEYLWTLSDTIEFVETFIIYPKSSLRVLQTRRYGEPKMSKPKELKGLKGISIDFIPKKCKFQYFKAGEDIYILCRDFFSPSLCPRPEDIGLPLEVLLKKYCNIDKNCKNFVYPDTWGCIVLRSEAWLKLSNYKIIHKQSKTLLDRSVAFKKVFTRGLLDYGCVIQEDDTYWQSFIERLSEEVYNGDMPR